jgi:cytochrome oxidase assembly protein ShyY1
MVWRFHPPLWSVAATLAGCALMVWLGLWQWQRGVDKQAMRDQYAAANTRAPVVLTVTSIAPSGYGAVAATAAGSYLPDHQLLLDNQVRNRVPGYHVWTPLRLLDGGIVMVNRGWLPQNLDRRILPTLDAPSTPQQVTGLWRALPQPGLRLDSGDCDPRNRALPWPRIEQYPTSQDLACLYGEPVVAGELLLSPEATDGYVREWAVGDNGFPPSRHYGYAAQWLAFAATLLGLFIKLNLKRRPT